MIVLLSPHIFLGKPSEPVKNWIIDEHSGDIDFTSYIFLQDLNANLGDEDGQTMIVIEEEAAV